MRLSPKRNRPRKSLCSYHCIHPSPAAMASATRVIRVLRRLATGEAGGMVMQSERSGGGVRSQRGKESRVPVSK